MFVFVLFLKKKNGFKRWLVSLLIISGLFSTVTTVLLFFNTQYVQNFVIIFLVCVGLCVCVHVCVCIRACMCVSLANQPIPQTIQPTRQSTNQPLIAVCLPTLLCAVRLSTTMGDNCVATTQARLLSWTMRGLQLQTWTTGTELWNRI